MLRLLAAGFPGSIPGNVTGGICGVQSGTGAGFPQVLRSPMPLDISPTAPHSSSSITRDWPPPPGPEKIKKNRH
jgi:hypothetical protein